MTTQHTDHEHNDVDTSVVGQSFAPETTTEPADSTQTAWTALPVETEAGTGTSSSSLESAVTIPAHQEHEEKRETQEATSAAQAERTEQSAQAVTFEMHDQGVPYIEAAQVESPEREHEQPTPVSGEGQGAQAKQAEHEAVSGPAAHTPQAALGTSEADEADGAKYLASDPATSAGTETTAMLAEIPESEVVVATEASEANVPIESAEPAFEEPANTIPAAEEEPAALDYTEVMPLAEVEQEVRPFTDFIEEFRQREARLSAALQEMPVESFAPSTQSGQAENPIELDEIAAIQASEARSEAEEILKDLVAPSSSLAAESVTAIPDASIAFNSEQSIQSAQSAASSAPNAQEAAPASATEQVRAESGEVAPAASQILPLPLERPMSPLLRPATRLRLPRHGGMRLREVREAQHDVAAAEASAEAAAQQLAASRESANDTEKQEQPRPTRRYRFDRPTAAPTTPAASTTSAQAPTGRAENSVGTNGNMFEMTAKQATSAMPPVMPPVAPVAEQPKLLSAQEAVPAEDTDATNVQAASPVTSAAQETAVEPERRRRHGQERQREKEQSTASTAGSQPAQSAQSAQSAAPVAEVPPMDLAAAQAKEIAPEDLPPLEYSELQKASTRRRRRHRSASNNGTAPVTAAGGTDNGSATPATKLPASSDLPAAQVAPQTVQPTTPTTTPALMPNQFSIVSGYTVNQMNQGNEVSGPFMGPDPSPARGSVLSRDGRNIRAEAQRSPVLPVRPNEPTISGGSVNQLASVLSQAIQTQTDRMVAELRRANQVPTNVSVSLPPFPSTERVGVFVDVANLLYSARTLRIAVDFGKLLDFLRGNRRLVRAHAYCPTSPQPGDDQMFLQAVKGLGYRITTKNYKTFSSGAKKADLDLDLCMDVVRIVDGRAVDCIVLVSGDSDFMPMLDYCSDHGVRVEVAAFDEAMSATLRQSCDLFINLSMLEEIRA